MVKLAVPDKMRHHVWTTFRYYKLPLVFQQNLCHFVFSSNVCFYQVYLVTPTQNPEGNEQKNGSQK